MRPFTCRLTLEFMSNLPDSRMAPCLETMCTLLAYYCVDGGLLAATQQWCLSGVAERA